MFIDKNSLVTDETIHTTFMLLTKDENKNITPSEFKDMLGINSNYSSKVWENIIKQIDQNGDGMVKLLLRY